MLGSGTVADLTERQLIARIQLQLPPAPAWLLVGIGDDGAVVEPERNRVEVLSVDAIVEGVHFDRAFVPPDAIGHRALAVNLSDLAAMGATPRLALLSMALPSALSLDDFDRMAAGFTALAARHRLHVVGGNLTRSPGPLMIDVTVMGTVKRRQALTRSGARPGDEVYVSGTIGAAAAGLRLLREGASRQSSVTGRTTGDPGQTIDDSGLTTDDSGLTTDDRRLMTAFLRPIPRIRLGQLLSRNRAASACMDLSDGLADGVHQIADASGVGMIIESDALPIDAGARSIFAYCRVDAMTEALTAGDDYELLVTARPRWRRRLDAAARQSAVPLTRIGACTEAREIVLRRPTDDAAIGLPVPPGYSHFR